MMLLSLALTGHETQHGGDGARCGLATRPKARGQHPARESRRGERLLPSPTARGNLNNPGGKCRPSAEGGWGGAEEHDTARGKPSELWAKGRLGGVRGQKLGRARDHGERHSPVSGRTPQAAGRERLQTPQRGGKRRDVRMSVASRSGSGAGGMRGSGDTRSW